MRINCDAHQGTSRVPWREPFGCQIRPSARYGTRHVHRLPARAVAALVADTVRSAPAQNPHRRERTRSQHRVIWHHKARIPTLREATRRGPFSPPRKVPPAHAAAKGRRRACAIRYAPDAARGGADPVDHARDAACLGGNVGEEGGLRGCEEDEGRRARGVEAAEGGGDVVTHVAPGRSSGWVPSRIYVPIQHRRARTRRSVAPIPT